MVVITTCCIANSKQWLLMVIHIDHVANPETRVDITIVTIGRHCVVVVIKPKNVFATVDEIKHFKNYFVKKIIIIIIQLNKGLAFSLITEQKQCKVKSSSSAPLQAS